MGSPTNDVVIEVEHLRKTYGGLVAVDDVSFDVRRGEIFGLLGRNGAGKTTTVECLEGLRRPDRGQLRLLGLDPTRDTVLLRRRIGAQLQDSGLPDRLRVAEALELFASMTPGGPDWRQTMADWGLGEKQNAPFGTLSGGQRQRLLVALALVNGPELVFLDELTTGLDPAARRAAWSLVERIRSRGTTVILVTHFMDEAERLCDRVAVVDRGRILALDSPQGLIDAQPVATRVRFSTDRAGLDWLAAVPGVSTVERRNAQVSVTGSGPLLALVATALVEHGVAPLDLRGERPNLEDVFLRLTGGPIEE